MKPLYIYSLFALSALVLVLFVSVRTRERNEKQRLGNQISFTSTANTMNSKDAVRSYEEALHKNPENEKIKLCLVWAYIQEAREYGNFVENDKAAMKLLTELLARNENNFEALCAQATILLSQHHFSEALSIGKKVVSIDNFNSFGYGILTDAYVELGDYDAATLAVNHMVAIRPDLRSYSRVSYLREIYGDVSGAVAAMKMATQSGIPGSEQTEWTRVYTGRLMEQQGQNDSAVFFYKTALNYRPHYAYAQAGMGSVAKTEGRYAEALKFYNNAKNSVPDYVFHSELAHIYTSLSRYSDASRELNEALTTLGGQSDQEQVANHGHYADKELAQLFLQLHNYDAALLHATKEYSRRPENIEINHTLAWVFYQRNDADQANLHIDKAMRTGSQNTLLLLHAGLIKIKAGKVEQGQKLIAESLRLNPNIPLELSDEINRVTPVSKFIANNYNVSEPLQ